MKSQKAVTMSKKIHWFFNQMRIAFLEWPHRIRETRKACFSPSKSFELCAMPVRS